jgi:hypothetical protein
LLNKWLRITPCLLEALCCGNGIGAIISMKLYVLCDIEAEAGNILMKFSA